MNLIFSHIVEESRGQKGTKKDGRKKADKYILSYIGSDNHEYRKSAYLTPGTKFTPIKEGNNKDITEQYNNMSI